MTAYTDLDAFHIEASDVAGPERLRKRTRLALRMVAALVIVFFGFAAFMKIGGAVVATGDVTVESSIKTVSHPTGGVLGSLSVRDGDHVAKGQELLRFDTTVSGVGSSSAISGLAELLARRARLEAERDGAGTIAFPSELTASANPRTRDLVVREQRLFALRHEDRRGALSLLTERIHQYEDQIRSYQAQIDATNQQAKLIQPELAGLRDLYNRKLVTLSRINELERTAAQFEGTRAALVANISETRAHISEVREQMLNIDKSSRSDAGTELATVVAQLNDQQMRVATADDAFSRSVVRAPQSGTIDKLAYTTIGSAIPAGQPILQIVPDRDALVVEGRIKPTDVDRVRVGQEARITFSGFDRQTTPDIPGVVTFISPDLAQDPRTSATYYRIKVRPDTRAMAAAPQIALKAGMPAEVFVKTGDRSILSFITKPLLDQIRYALREG
jgi:HlyD family type I secretion membrane fusion protein